MDRRTVLRGAAAALALPWSALVEAIDPAIRPATGLAGPVTPSWPPSAWPAVPAPCVRCGRVVEYMAVVVDGYACDVGPGNSGDCARHLPRPPMPAGWPVNIPPDWPVTPMPAGQACEHCGRAGGPALQWPEPGAWMCAPGEPGCWCDDTACCGEPAQVGDVLYGLSPAPQRLPVPLGVIRRVEGARWPRRYLVELPDGGARWYDERDWSTW